MTELNPAVAGIEMPDGIKALRLDPVRGFPVPWFVTWVGGRPEFRVADARRLVEAVKKNLCWVCGRRLGTEFTFVLGPMCAVNRTSSEPPAHLECGVYSVKACPFLARPQMGRREGGLPEEGSCAGFMIKRNPGATGLWTTPRYDLIRVANGVLFNVGEPTSVSWWREGRAATREEVLESVRSGLPILESECDREATDAAKSAARNQLRRMAQAALAYYPAA